MVSRFEDVRVTSPNMPFPQSKTEQMSAANKARQPYIPPGMTSIPKPGDPVPRFVNRQQVQEEKPVQEEKAQLSPAQIQQAMRQLPHVRPTEPTPGADAINGAYPNGQARGRYAPVSEHVPEVVLNEQPGLTHVMSDPEAVSIALPSRFAFYDCKDLYIQPFRGMHFAKLSRAHEEDSLQPLIEAVSSVLSNTNGDKNIGFDLTVPDFYFVLYWLRINSYTKTFYTHSTTCTNKEHVNKVAKGDLKAETLKISQQIRKTNLRSTDLLEIPNPEIFTLSNSDLYLRPATMRDTLEYTEHPRFMETEFHYLANLACHFGVRGFKNGNSPDSINLDQRVEIANWITAEDIELIKRYEALTAEYGVVESIVVTCKECGASRESELSLDARSFLPTISDGGGG